MEEVFPLLKIYRAVTVAPSGKKHYHPEPPEWYRLFKPHEVLEHHWRAKVRVGGPTGAMEYSIVWGPLVGRFEVMGPWGDVRGNLSKAQVARLITGLRVKDI